MLSGVFRKFKTHSDEESLPDWADADPSTGDLQNIDEIHQQTQKMAWGDTVGDRRDSKLEDEFSSNSDSEHNLLAPTQCESPAPEWGT